MSASTRHSARSAVLSEFSEGAFNGVGYEKEGGTSSQNVCAKLSSVRDVLELYE